MNIAQMLIADIVKKPEILAYRWFKQKLFEESLQVKAVVKDWLISMNKVREGVSDAVDRIN